MTVDVDTYSWIMDGMSFRTFIHTSQHNFHPLKCNLQSFPTMKERDEFGISCIWDGGEREFELPLYYIHFEIAKFSQSNTESIVYLADLYNFHPLRCNLQRFPLWKTGTNLTFHAFGTGEREEVWITTVLHPFWNCKIQSIKYRINSLFSWFVQFSPP